ncbi:hypothetical protein MKW92_028764, partial [Papaver armeniacum]
MKNYFDCSQVQPYVLNGERDIFLNTRPRARVKRSNLINDNGAYCKVCDNSLADLLNKYCCIECK